MPTTHRVKQGETLDLICWRHYGPKTGMIEAVLAANFGLSEQPPVLPIGLSITLPDLPAGSALPAARIKLWD